MSPTSRESVTNHVKADIDVEEVARMCKALGHPARIKLLKHLADSGECYFGRLTDVLPLAASTVSQHVAVLKEAGLILGSTDEQRVCYHINPDRLQELQRAIGNL